jgi:hypothetical protein
MNVLVKNLNVDWIFKYIFADFVDQAILEQLILLALIH